MERRYIVKLGKFANSPEDKLAVRPFAQVDASEHGHDCFEFVYVTSGSAIQRLNGVAEYVSRGDYFIIDYGSFHAYEQCENLQLINCLFFPEIIDDTLSGCRSFDELLRVSLIRYHKHYFEKNTVDRIFHDEDGRILQLLTGMQTEYERVKIGYQEIFRCRFQEILILTMRKVLKEISREEQGEQSQMVLEAIRYMEAHYGEKAVLGRFCQEYHYSQQYVSRRFKQETGLTALEYLQKVRIEKCCELLTGSDLRIVDIAQQAGYDDIKFFNTVFKRLVHMSPREYRKLGNR